MNQKIFLKFLSPKFIIGFCAILAQIFFIISLLGGASIKLVAMGMLGVIALVLALLNIE